MKHILAWQNQPRVKGRFVPRDRAATITPSSSTPSSGTSTPSTESSLTLSIADPNSPFEDPSELPSNPQPDSTQHLTQAKPVAPHETIILIMSVPVAVSSFSGDPDDDVQPGEFLKTFHHFITYACITENSNIINSFGDHLKYGSPADKWFTKFDTLTSMWKDVEKAFLERFPPVAKAKRTETELERELCELRLKVDDLGKKEKYAGEDVYTHFSHPL